MFIIKNKRIFIMISIVLVVLSIGSISYFGLKLGIDFKEGALSAVEYTTVRPSQELVAGTLDPL